MKVYMIDHFSSVNQYSVELSEELGKMTDLTVLTVNDSVISDNHNFKYKKILYGHYDKGSFEKKVIYLSKLIGLAIQIIKGRPDVLHIQTFFKYEVEVKLYQLLKPFVGKYIYTCHNVAPHEQKQKKSPYHKIFKLANRIIVHNDVCKSILVNDNEVPEEKIVVIPHATYGMTAEKSVGIIKKNDHSKIELLQFGLIRKYKGVNTFIEALNYLPESYKKKIHVTIAGKQDKKLDDTDYAGLIDKYNLNEIVTFCPVRISDDDMVKMFKEADACVCPYVNIYGSGALLMAYTFGVPVIASKIPAFEEETDGGKTGFLFDVGNYKDLAKKIIDFIDLDDDLIQAKKKEIHRLVTEKYSWKKSAEKTYNAYVE